MDSFIENKGSVCYNGTNNSITINAEGTNGIRNGGNDLIPGRMPKGVIKRFKVIDIKHTDGKWSLQTDCTKTVPVIMITTLSDIEHEQRGLTLGAVDYISKPFRPRELVSRMRSVLRRTGHPSYRLNDLRILRIPFDLIP